MGFAATLESTTRRRRRTVLAGTQLDRVVAQRVVAESQRFVRIATLVEVMMVLGRRKMMLMLVVVMWMVVLLVDFEAKLTGDAGGN